MSNKPKKDTGTTNSNELEHYRTGPVARPGSDRQDGGIISPYKERAEKHTHTMFKKAGGEQNTTTELSPLEQAIAAAKLSI